MVLQFEDEVINVMMEEMRLSSVVLSVFQCFSL